MKVLRNSFVVRVLALFMLINIISQVCFPTLSMALTSGPSQPEVQSFQPASTTDMVNMFTGDFTYNIPLFELPGPDGGYPFNLAYNSGISMDQEASWVGLGWNLNPGALNREMRGLPDDFNGDKITREMYMRPNWTIGVGGNSHAATGLEIWGFDLKVGVGMSVFYNSYNGIGYSLDPTFSFAKTKNNEKETSLNLGLTLNSQEGVGFNPSLSISTKSDLTDRKMSIGVGYNSNAGFSALNLQYEVSKRHREKGELDIYAQVLKDANGLPAYLGTLSWDQASNWSATKTKLGASYGFESPSYVPRINMPMQTRNVSLSFLFGPDIVGFDGYFGATGYFSTEYVAERSVSKAAFGYLYMQNDPYQSSLVDFNRSQDGQILKNTPYLPSPYLTQDIYSANAQGISAMYRPSRSDLGVVYDDVNLSQSFGGSTGAELGFGTAGLVTSVHLGFDLSVNYSGTVSGLWRNNNDWKLKTGFRETNPFNVNDKLYETAYFKVFGEPTSTSISQLDAIGGFEPYRVSLDDHAALAGLENDKGNQLGNTNLANYFLTNTQRKIRQASIVPFKNQDISLVPGGLTEFTIDYYTSIADEYYKSAPTSFASTRSSLNKDHIGGFVSTNPNGMKYVYALPAYNSKQVEHQFSLVKTDSEDKPVIAMNKNGDGTINHKADRTNFYKNRIVTPPYAHSYLLTAVLGADYIDADAIKGPSEGDLGYWVKFTYVKAHAQFKWRTPFSGANNMPNSNTTIVDDMGSYVYGEKEIWHLAKAETKSHVAVFKILPRNDAKGANDEAQNPTDATIASGNTSFKLDKITLYTRDEYNVAGNTGKPIVKVRFEYNYDLCGFVSNNQIGSDVSGLIPNSSLATVNKGKLTLKKVWFEYGNNTRGALSPYLFDYHERLITPPNNINLDENPNYLVQGMDRWGTYKPYDTNNKTEAINFLNKPYTKQFNENDPTRNVNNFRSVMDKQAAVWSLKSIKLPSGGKIDVTYEADDYGYVQNKVATQMFTIAGTNSKGNNGFDHSNLKVFFPLEKSMPAGATTAQIQAEIKKYIPDNNQVYFKVYSNFAKTGNSNEDLADYVSGYAEVDLTDIGISDNNTGYIKLKKSSFGGSNQYHPFALAAWLHIRTNAPYLLNIAGMRADPASEVGDKQQKLASLLSSLTSIKKIFSGFYGVCNSRGLGMKIDLSRSMIRLNTPDKIKIGGGHRVKQIVLSDSWSEMTTNAEKTNYYGQVYDYTMEENGQIISSGVASNEPQVGGEESVLRRTELVKQKVPGLTPNRLLVEFPINDAYYPGAAVGYRKVTVKSIASNYTGQEGNVYEIPGGILRSGAVSYDFYTAKEFPVIEKYTNTKSHEFNLPLPIPFIGRTDINKLTISQGFYIELNDMHGKVKMVSNYSIDRKGIINPIPESYTKYNYQATAYNGKTGDPVTPKSTDNENTSVDYYKLDNKVKVLLSDNGVTETDDRYLGQDVECFSDMRESETTAMDAGFNLNLEWVIVPIAGVVTPTSMPRASLSYSRCRTTVTNKIVNKFGIITSIENYNNGSKMTVSHKWFDAYTGQPLLTTINNHFDDPVYSYTLPAHLVNEYKRIGGKYNSQQFAAKVSITGSGTNLDYTLNALTSLPAGSNVLQKGDKVFITEYDSETNDPYFSRQLSKVVAVITSTTTNLTGKLTAQSNFNAVGGHVYRLEMYDPVYDNNYDQTVFSVSSLQDPTINRIDKNCTVNYIYPYNDPICEYKNMPEQCFVNVMENINSYLQTTAYTNRSAFAMNDPNKLICNNTYSGSTATMTYLPSGGFKILNTRTQVGEGQYQNVPIDAYFYNANGTAVDFDQVASITEFFIDLNFNGFPPTFPQLPGVPINETQTGSQEPLADLNKFYYSAYKAKILLKNGSTIYAYILFHRFAVYVNGVRSNDAYLKVYTKTVPVCRDSIKLATGTLNLNYKSLNKVLNVSASTLTEFKPIDNNSLVNKNLSLTAISSFDLLVAYLNGSAGTFQTKESWAYLDDRSQTTTVATRTDGTFDDVPFFKFNSPLSKGCPARWKRVVTFTDYIATGMPVEEEDALANKSAVLFGYSNSLVTAMASNASVYEIGFESFEDYPGTTAILMDNYIGKNNLNFYTAVTNRTMDAFANYTVLSANKNMLILNKRYNTDLEIISADIDGQEITTGATLSGRYAVSGIQAYPGDASKTIIILNTTILDNVGPWMGNGKFKLKQSSRGLKTADILSNLPPYINSTVSHTGKSSLAVTVGAVFEQRRLLVTPGKKMVFEAWVKALSFPPNAGVRFYDKTGTLVTANNINFGLSTITVEGWTKIYGEFVVPVGTESLGIYLFGGAGQSGPGTSYFDDIRIYPAESNMVSYVYDRSNYKLRATLDNNNFATLYYYDPSGNLYLTKKETERGIVTMQESQSQIKSK
ncbi:hypothetical protein [Cytophaga hutchinsonii]|uniref:PA14 domain-containing protein n=1 Tax=Cytophaga hutchinsonii (strain ATCC 33406 / DSM 1761 / CIP 103989 / NBRC 15051 / NCIMB 9469 / D465) TaxID=269798 RepID=A0A6N4SVY8_CYTH3|nr:hypothetical protein [Cytophaga hutchinsonii]ABG60449.1 conserved hypothetical protein [Cytophaga hutchinsonii ATCC 33406]SFX85722.1 hypothetical protein SAMN04487930_11170 [Cytophaga hutchinsonii ATCC 33406]